VVNEGLGWGRGREDAFLGVEVSSKLIVGIVAGPETEILGVSGRTIVGTVAGEQVIAGMEGGSAPFTWIAGGPGW
jgi:hypothetical protein